MDTPGSPEISGTFRQYRAVLTPVLAVDRKLRIRKANPAFRTFAQNRGLSLPASKETLASYFQIELPEFSQLTPLLFNAFKGESSYSRISSSTAGPLELVIMPDVNAKKERVIISVFQAVDSNGKDRIELTSVYFFLERGEFCSSEDGNPLSENLLTALPKTLIDEVENFAISNDAESKEVTFTENETEYNLFLKFVNENVVLVQYGTTSSLPPLPRSVFNERFSRVLNHIPHALIVFMGSGKILYHNPAASGFFQQGISILGNSVFRLLFSGSADQSKLQQFMDGVTSHSPFEIEPLLYPWPGHKEKAYKISCRPLPDEEVTDLYLLTLIDLTEAYWGIIESQIKNQYNEEIVNLVPDLILIHDKELTLLDYKYYDKAGLLYPLDSSIGKKITDIVLPEVENEVRKKYLNILYSLDKGEKKGFLEYTLTINERTDHYELYVTPYGTDRYICFIHDITLRKKAELELQLSNERFSIIVNHTRQLLFYLDTETDITSWEGTAENITGYTIEELKQLNWIDCVYEEDREKLEALFTNWKNEGSAYHAEYRFRHKAGNIIYLEESGNVLIDRNTGRKKIVGIIREITERKQYEEALVKSEQRYKSFIVNSNEAIWCFDVKTPVDITLNADEQIKLFYSGANLYECNEVYAGMYGFASPEEIIGKPLSDFLIPDEPGNIEMLKAFITANYRLENVETVEYDKDGKKHFFLNTMIGYTEDGRLLRCWGTQQDITSLKEIEFALHSAEFQYKSIFDNAIEGIYRSKPEGRFISVNPAFAAMFGFNSPEEYIASIEDISLQLYQDPENRQVFLRTLREKGEVRGYESLAKRKDGSSFWIYENARLIVTPLGEEIIEGTLEDITERKNAAEAILQSEQRYRSLIELSSDCIAHHSGGIIEYINPAGIEMFEGNSAQDFIGQRLLDFVHEDSKKVVLDRLTKLYASDERVPPIIEKLVTFSGKVIHCEVSAKSFIYAGKPFTQVRVRDITGKRREEMLRNAQSELLGLINKNTQLHTVLSRLCTLFEEIETEAIAGVLLENEHGYSVVASEPEYVQLWNLSIHRLSGYFNLLMASGENSPLVWVQNIYNHPDLEWFFPTAKKYSLFSVGALPLITSNGSVIGKLLIGMSSKHYDVEQEKSRLLEWSYLASIAYERDTLDDELQKLSTIAKQSTNAIVVLDLDFRITWVNEGYTKIAGFEKEHLLGKNINRLFWQRPGNSHLTENVEEKLARAESVKLTAPIESLSGNTIWVELSLDAMRGKEGEVEGYIGIATDITEMIRKEEQLHIAKIKAEESSKLKSSFLANMSHEIRTPLNGILGFADILREELLRLNNQDMVHFANTIYSSGRRLLGLLNDILDISRIEANKMELELRPFSVSETIEKVKVLFEPLVRAKNILLEYTPTEHIYAVGDENRLGQVLNNIIGNAVKFTETGSVKISALYSRDPETEGMVVITVSDTGRGIESEFMDHIFEPFRQESTGFSRSHEGSGLGLAISQRLINLMYGKIEIKSQKSQGTDVIILIPAHRPEDGIVQQVVHTADKILQLQSEIARVRPLVLVVEDDENSSKVLKLMLQLSCETVCVSNGDEAIRIVQVYEAQNRHFDIVLMDIGLPAPWDGILLRNEIIARFPSFKMVPFVAQTAITMKEEREEIINSGFAEFVSKPIDRLELFNKVFLSLQLKSSVN